MIKLLKKMAKREVLMAVLCTILVLGQVYFDLTLPDYMTDLTMMLNTAGSETSDILNVGLKMLGCTLASAALAIGCGYLSAKTASGFSYTVREKLFNHVMDMGSEEMQDFSIPSLITRTTNDITQIQMIISMGLQMIIKSPIMAVWAVIKILGKSWELSAVTAAFVVVICVFVLAVMATCIPRFRIVQKLTDKINRVARENLTGINVVHAFNAEKYQNDKFDVPSKEMMNTQLKNQRMFALMMPVMNIGMNGLTLAIYWLGAVLIQQIALTAVQDRITLFSNVVVFSTYATYVVMSFMMLVMIFMMLPAAQVSAERINEVLERDVNIKEGSVSEGNEQGTVEFKNVSFRYPHASEDELSNISFKINKGQTLAIIGATGSGKTTLISLIPRFYDATEGEVLVDGVNVKDYKFDTLYDKLGYVTQKAVLFAGSIRENVFFGESAAPETDEELKNAIGLSQAEEFVDKLPDGTEHMISQMGRNVSGGQKQRLSIARALSRKPEILVFDDSFSALDYKTDAKLREGLNEKLKDTTKIIVAQRISTIRHADKIIVLDRGEAVGMGTHDELMKNCDVYKEIALSQLSAAELA
ncbi:ABC transporter ATP-binding protein [Ruminococcus sp. AF17-6LB]|uniref:ABC transporter ATP-binding protein n=1 Tax=unclassified Ruminococcus TaxID=2608920 RepID=UPI000E4CB064|nr:MULTISPECIES: ABC transporter ATP-binding protein [unclassified Ruminococcus]RGG69504.1 ABC transporter ATP-binding protein [Ruminococcus sp. AF17-6LB]RGG70953.1 ABC transporter ATP-binding protein [Ruminococcus sp. AF17-6]RGG71548.1 ABC transporter ATP-binding protein [Ruminococcus sp. AF17-24]RGG78976.1 ABC transporter ATP-binding protein [Ruminococcus sp. AF17-1AC]